MPPAAVCRARGVAGDGSCLSASVGRCSRWRRRSLRSCLTERICSRKGLDPTTLTARTQAGNSAENVRAASDSSAGQRRLAGSRGRPRCERRRVSGLRNAIGGDGLSGRGDDVRAIEQPRPLLARGPVHDVAILEHLRQRTAPGALSDRVLRQVLLASRTCEESGEGIAPGRHRHEHRSRTDRPAMGARLHFRTAAAPATVGGDGWSGLAKPQRENAPPSPSVRLRKPSFAC